MSNFGGINYVLVNHASDKFAVEVYCADDLLMEVVESGPGEPPMLTFVPPKDGSYWRIRCDILEEVVGTASAMLAKLKPR